MNKVSTLSGEDSKIKLRRFAMHPYFAGDVERYTKND